MSTLYAAAGGLSLNCDVLSIRILKDVYITWIIQQFIFFIEV